MKIALHCRSRLLEQSLKHFLKGFTLVESGEDLCICDYDKQTHAARLRIGTDGEADLVKPFTRSQLLLKLEELQRRAALADMGKGEESLEEKIEEMTRTFVRDIVRLVKEHGEKEV